MDIRIERDAKAIGLLRSIECGVESRNQRRRTMRNTRPLNCKKANVVVKVLRRRKEEDMKP